MICIFSVCHDTQREGGGVELHKSQLGAYEVGGIGAPGEEERDYAVCPVPDVLYDKVYIGQDAPDGQFYRMDPIPGRTFAEAIVNACQIGGGGIAIAAGEIPQAGEVAAARTRYLAWLDLKLRSGQARWLETRSPTQIEHFARVAALALGATVEWVSPSVSSFRKRCENCDDLVPARAVYCPKCDFPFDLERAAAAGNAQAVRALEQRKAAEEERLEAAAVATRGKSGKG